MALDLSCVRALIFDIDGTLADTDDHLVQQLAAVIDAVPLVSSRRASELARRIVMDAETPVNAAYGLLDRLGLDDEASAVKDAIRSAAARLRELREDPADSRNEEATDHVPHTMIAGVQAMLPRLAERFPMSTVSTGGAARVEAFLRHYEVHRLFAAVITAQTTPRMKPYPDPVFYAAETMRVEPESILLIGDTTVDMTAATSAGAQALGVLCGFGTEDELFEAGAARVVPTTSDVLPLLLPSADPLGGGAADPAA